MKFTSDQFILFVVLSISHCGQGNCGLLKKGKIKIEFTENIEKAEKLLMTHHTKRWRTSLGFKTSASHCSFAVQTNSVVNAFKRKSSSKTKSPIPLHHKLFEDHKIDVLTERGTYENKAVVFTHTPQIISIEYPLLVCKCNSANFRHSENTPTLSPSTSPYASPYSSPSTSPNAFSFGSPNTFPSSSTFTTYNDAGADLERQSRRNSFETEEAQADSDQSKSSSSQESKDENKNDNHHGSYDIPNESSGQSNHSEYHDASMQVNNNDVKSHQKLNESSQQENDSSQMFITSEEQKIALTGELHDTTELVKENQSFTNSNEPPANTSVSITIAKGDHSSRSKSRADVSSSKSSKNNSENPATNLSENQSREEIEVDTAAFEIPKMIVLTEAEQSIPAEELLEEQDNLESSDSSEHESNLKNKEETNVHKEVDLATTSSSSSSSSSESKRNSSSSNKQNSETNSDQFVEKSIEKKSNEISELKQDESGNIAVLEHSDQDSESSESASEKENESTGKNDQSQSSSEESSSEEKLRSHAQEGGTNKFKSLEQSSIHFNEKSIEEKSKENSELKPDESGNIAVSKHVDQDSKSSESASKKENGSFGEKDQSEESSGPEKQYSHVDEEEDGGTGKSKSLEENSNLWNEKSTETINERNSELVYDKSENLAATSKQSEKEKPSESSSSEHHHKIGSVEEPHSLEENSSDVSSSKNQVEASRPLMTKEERNQSTEIINVAEELLIKGKPKTWLSVPYIPMLSNSGCYIKRLRKFMMAEEIKPKLFLDKKIKIPLKRGKFVENTVIFPYHDVLEPFPVQMLQCECNLQNSELTENLQNTRKRTKKSFPYKNAAAIPGTLLCSNGTIYFSKGLHGDNSFFIYVQYPMNSGTFVVVAHLVLG